jgi:ABC-type uncharacterized transport system involved in gliding motility auxiliary subunit
MVRWAKFLGIVGLVLLAVGIGGASVISSQFIPVFFITHIVIGAVCVTLWFLLYGMKALGQPGGVVSNRGIRFGTSVALYTMLFLVLLTGVNWYVNKHNKRWDLTEQGVYSLASQSYELLKNASDEIEIRIFDNGQINPEQARDLLDLYREANPGKVKTELILAKSNPQLVEKYAMKGGNLVYIGYGKNASKGASRVNEIAEEQITNAIVKLTKGAEKKIYYVVGHGEPDITNTGEQGAKALVDAMADEHLKVESLQLATASKIPDDAAAVLLVSPSKALQAFEQEALVKYANQGGGLVLFTDPRKPRDIASIASKFDITIGDDAVIDMLQRLFSGSLLDPIGVVGAASDITRTFGPEDNFLFSLASSVKVPAAKEGSTASYVELIKTGPNAWAETDLVTLLDSEPPTAQLDPTDTKGPVTIAATYSKPVDESKEGSKKIKVVVFGDSDFVLNNRLPTLFNRDLLLNSINWAAGESSGFAIRPRTLRSSQAAISEQTFKQMLALVFLLPELFLIAGLSVWWRRKHVAVA